MKHPRRVLWLFALAGVLIGGVVGWGRRDVPPGAAAAGHAQMSAQTDGIDRTAELRDANPGADWLPVLVSATAYSSGLLRVSTTIVDPGGPDGSPEAVQAIAVCRAAAAMMQQGHPSPLVYVVEIGGTTFAAYGLHLAPEHCVEL